MELSSPQMMLQKSHSAPLAVSTLLLMRAPHSMFPWIDWNPLKSPGVQGQLSLVIVVYFYSEGLTGLTDPCVSL